MRVVVALGGNALLRRGEPMTVENQRRNVAVAAEAIAVLATGREVVLSHGNGPQVGLLALQSAAHDPEHVFPLDILDAETEGMIGYLIEQELANRLPSQRPTAALLTQVEVAADDPAFAAPTKPIGPVYAPARARALARERGWHISPDGDGYRRVVASPKPRRIVELSVIRLLLEHGVVVICAGGGGIPVVALEHGGLTGVEAVIDKDLASALLAREIGADALLMLTDVDAVYAHWGQPDARPLTRISVDALQNLSFAPGSMGPKIAAACEFVESTGGIAGIGALKDAERILRGETGTLIARHGMARL